MSYKKTEMTTAFSNNLKTMLRIKGLSQKNVADALHVSPATVSSWCSGREFPRTELFDKLCNLLDCDRSDFLGGNKPDSTALSLDDDEIVLIDYYRSLSKKDQRILRSIAKMMGRDDLGD